jgi:general secretion pathway protein D
MKNREYFFHIKGAMDMHASGLEFRRVAALLLLAAAVLAGCAGQKLHREGMTLLEEGRTEEGLSKLEQASKADPDDLTYRTAWLRNREQVANRWLRRTANAPPDARIRRRRSTSAFSR